MSQLRIVMSDQLSTSISSLQGCDQSQDYILMCEVKAEATYVKHHKKKLAFLFSAMRHFALELRDLGYQLHYTKLDDKENSGTLRGEVQRLLRLHAFDGIILTFPAEYRILEDVQSWEKAFGVPVEIRNDDRFLCSPEEFSAWAKDRKQVRMEYFYREMRKKYFILMEGDSPEGGQWNYDTENRKPPKEGLYVPPPYQWMPDSVTQEVMGMIEISFPDHFGDLNPFFFAVTREHALLVLNDFIENRLATFGEYQDAMVEGEPWMFHSHLSFYLNCGLLLPLECVHAAQKAYYQRKAPLNAVEGFIRQIIGWREYIRGVYWLKMPSYAHENYLEATRALPDFYWTGETSMNCLKQCVTETKENAYAHHIQRLMVLGNFALLAGIEPREVQEWFLIVYADAFEWVELPNVVGMILFADGGYVASKPYAAGGSYINKMSDYCKNCAYKVTVKNGPEACPFNYLYWDFLLRHKRLLSPNPRMAMMYKVLEKMGSQKQQMNHLDTSKFLDELPSQGASY